MKELSNEPNGSEPPAQLEKDKFAKTKAQISKFAEGYEKKGHGTTSRCDWAQPKTSKSQRLKRAARKAKRRALRKQRGLSKGRRS